MSVYSVEGKLGTGKTKFCVWMAQQALRAGRRVASNVDLRLEALTPERRSTYCRIPDKPSPFDLDAIGHGNPESYDEDRNGVLILDELGTWLNSRTFNDKSRAPVVDFLIHARKKGWDVFLIVQDAGMIDRQVREALIEYQVRCLRLDKVRIPVLGHFLEVFGPKAAYLPRMHLATARVGYGPGAIVSDRWSFRGDDLHAAYDTRQVFTPEYPHGAACMLPAWDFQPVTPGWLKFKRAVAGFVGRGGPPRRLAPVAKLSIVRSLEGLPPHERIRHARRLISRGLI